jgi:sigma-B regulation protein RsbU (phosphoserine phosphatase)
VGDEKRDLWEEAACGLALTADDGTFLRVNGTLCRWLGRTSSELVGERRVQDLLRMGGRIFHQTHWVPLLRMQGSISEVKFELVHADGTPIPTIWNAIRRVEGDVAVHDLAVYIARDRDIYERELIEARKRQEILVADAKRHRDEAGDRAAFAEEMVGIVSHDLRNPLSAVGMGAALLEGGELTARQRRLLTTIGRAVRRATRLIEDLLDFTQARVGRGLAVQPSQLDLHGVIADTIDELSVRYDGRSVVHERRGAGTCWADGQRLAQLVGNLVSNAMAYGDPEAPVTVTSDIEAERFTISVHNEGAPIPDEIRATLFHPMVRGAAGGRSTRSVGLGLYIVHEIARVHAGTASVTSTAEAGTTFRATFPSGSV